MGSVALSQPYLYVTQPEGVLLKLKLEDVHRFQTSKTLETLQPLSSLVEGQDMPAEIVTHLKTKGEPSEETLVVATADGTVSYLRNDKVVWFRQLQNHLFGLNKVDINLDGNDSVVVSTWEGQVIQEQDVTKRNRNH